MSARSRLLIVKTGSAFAEARRRFGDFETWFIRSFGPKRFDYRTIDVSLGEPPPDRTSMGEFAGVVVTGSPAMVSHRLEWSERIAVWLAELVGEDRLPVLGVCYGHQLIAHGLGGRVGPNPHGRRMGTRRLAVDTPDDALLGPLAPTASVNVTHLEAVLEPPPSARVLGRTEDDPNHVLHFGGRSWGVQFHPEFDAAIMRCYVEARRELLDGEGFDSKAILEDVTDTRAGPGLLERFADICESTGGDDDDEGR
ncbi:glutamine amidotransferase [Wenzhouxiangella sediminis]|uniref:glutamine amidotransferase n=1 Tax=Wenzhouxiangella sediminis TaxID=1792836 RepID=UPI0015F27BC7|nr:glutamine amidotransferase [Wenzhouxiangella sediminis]